MKCEATMLKLVCFKTRTYAEQVVLQHMLLCDCKPLTWVPLQFTYMHETYTFLLKTVCLEDKKQEVTANGTSFGLLWKFL